MDGLGFASELVCATAMVDTRRHDVSADLWWRGYQPVDEIHLIAKDHQSSTTTTRTICLRRVKENTHKMRAVVLLCLLSQVLAGPGKPDISIGYNSDSIDKGPIGVVEPHIKWETSGTFSGFDVDVRCSAQCCCCRRLDEQLCTRMFNSRDIPFFAHRAALT